METRITERWQVSIPRILRCETHLEPGPTVLWEEVSATEFRLVVMLDEDIAADPIGALGFARQHGLKEGASDAYLRALRNGEGEDEP